jgi:biofilm PGA synthesis N-glycosyltransferase PgaC
VLPMPRYVLVTPARNEAQFIEKTIKAVLAQTVPPENWIIVSDGSTDGTDEIVRKYAAANSWIELVQMPLRRDRNFEGKAHAFNAGCARLVGSEYELIGNVDADISFDKDYFAFLLQAFVANPQLGIAGTGFTEGSFQYDYRFTSTEHVFGPCQLFRRACLEEIGGYMPREVGGEDLVAVLTARRNGWQTRTFLEKAYQHHRQSGTAERSATMAQYEAGRADYILGSHPLWQFLRSVYQIRQRPILIGGILRHLGYLSAMAARTRKEVPADLIRFRREDQMRRLREGAVRLFSPWYRLKPWGGGDREPG